MEELNRLIEKNGAVIKEVAKPQVVAPVVIKLPAPAQEKPINLEAIASLREKNNALSGMIKQLTDRIDEQDKLIAKLSDDEASETPCSPKSFKFKINRNSDGLIDNIQVNGESEADEAVENKTLTAVKEALTKGK